jgi:UDP-2-acetamido-2-deoxy-ribo-hexuluronate aminotransferase
MSKNIPFFSLERQSKKLEKIVSEQFSKIIENNIFIGGPLIKECEKGLSKYLNVKHAATCNSGTDALWLALKALDIQKDNIVLTTPFSFIASSSEIVAHGAHPVFIDIDENTYNIDPQKIKTWLEQNATNIDGKTKDKKTGRTISGIITVDLFGQCADYEKIKKIADEWNLWIIEDACQAVGSHVNKTMAGNLGDIACFSFYPTKNLGAWGDGGVATTNNPELAQTLLKLRNHGRAANYDYECYGINSRLDAFQAATVLEKLKIIDELTNRRREIAQIYNKELSNLDFLKCPQEKVGHHVYHQYCVTIENKNGKSLSDELVRDELKSYLEKNNIGTNIFYPKCLHEIPYLQTDGQLKTDCPIAEKTTTIVLALPIWPELTNEEVEHICSVIKQFKS